MFGAIGQLGTLAKSNSVAETSLELADTPKDDYDFGLQRWMKKRGKFYRPNLSTNEVKEYKDAFRVIDLDGSGTLEVDELVQAMRALDQPVSVYEMTKLVEMIAPGKGFLNETDFIELVHYRSLPNTTKQNAKKDMEAIGEEKPKKVQVSMGILAGTFRRKKALDLLMMPWEIRNNTVQEAERQSELSQILIRSVESQTNAPTKINIKTTKAKCLAKQNDKSATSASDDDREEDQIAGTEELLSMPLLPPGLSHKLRNEAIRQTIPTTYSASLMSRIEEKIKTEVAWETTEMSKTAFYLPPVHKRKQHPYVENVDSRNLSPQMGRLSQASGFFEQNEFERKKQLLLKRYSFPSTAPIVKSPKEMDEPYAFLAQQLILSNESSMHAKQRAKKKVSKNAAIIDVSQVMKDAETLLQTAKLALRQSRCKALDTPISPANCESHPKQRSESPSSINSSPKAIPGPLQNQNPLNNSPIAPVLNSVQKIDPKVSFSHGVNHSPGPIIRIFKAEMAPVVPHRTKNQLAGGELHARDLNGEGRRAVSNRTAMNADVCKADKAPTNPTKKNVQDEK